MVRKGYLSQYFAGVAIKRLSAVEADSLRSNQHEYNGDKGMRKLLGKPDQPIRYDTKFLYFTDHDYEAVEDNGFLTWYDSRQKARLERNINRSEYRLYFPSNRVIDCTSAGDLLVVAKRENDQLLAMVAEQGSTIERQLAWLFGFSDEFHPGFSVRAEMGSEQDKIGYAARIILENIGISVDEEEPNYLDEMLRRFGKRFPLTTDFSAYARETIPDLSSRDDPDGALIAWMEREEVLFRTFEKHLFCEEILHIREDFDSVIDKTKSLFQRRRARAGYALENHLEQIFREQKIRYTRDGITEGRAKPDFVFPSIASYHDDEFSPSALNMLAAKSTCKDRWRQILTEAAKIPEKHLLTLEPSISAAQTTEMQVNGVQLVVPRGLVPTFREDQRRSLMTLGQFVDFLAAKQQRASA